MRTLKEFIFESIGIADLTSNMEFVEVKDMDVQNILDTDDYNHGKDLGVQNVDDLCWVIDGYEISKHYKIMYKGNILGVFGICPGGLKRGLTPEPITAADITVNLCCLNDLIQYTNKRFKPIFLNRDAINSVPVKSFLDNIDTKNAKKHKIKYTGDSYILEEFINFFNTTVESVLHKTIYISYLQINKNIKNRIDINNIAVIKVFFDNLLRDCRKKGIDYIMAFGKDKDTTDKYIKVGGFESLRYCYEIIKEYPIFSLYSYKMLMPRDPMNSVSWNAQLVKSNDIKDLVPDKIIKNANLKVKDVDVIPGLFNIYKDGTGEMSFKFNLYAKSGLDLLSKRENWDSFVFKKL